MSTFTARMAPMSTTTRWLDAEETHAWRAWLDLNNRLFARLNRELQATRDRKSTRLNSSH